MLIAPIVNSGRMLPQRWIASLAICLFAGAVTATFAAMTLDAVAARKARVLDARLWEDAQPVMVKRLNQDRALEYGQVWATHAGVICGTVYGRYSFPGMTSMTPFFLSRKSLTFQADSKFDEFTPFWRDCVSDQWIVIKTGSTRSGYCGTPAQKQRCEIHAYF